MNMNKHNNTMKTTIDIFSNGNYHHHKHTHTTHPIHSKSKTHTPTHARCSGTSTPVHTRTHTLAPTSTLPTLLHTNNTLAHAHPAAVNSLPSTPLHHSNTHTNTNTASSMPPSIVKALHECFTQNQVLQSEVNTLKQQYHTLSSQQHQNHSNTAAIYDTHHPIAAATATPYHQQIVDHLHQRFTLIENSIESLKHQHTQLHHHTTTIQHEYQQSIGSLKQQYTDELKEIHNVIDDMNTKFLFLQQYIGSISNVALPHRSGGRRNDSIVANNDVFALPTLQPMPTSTHTSTSTFMHDDRKNSDGEGGFSYTPQSLQIRINSTVNLLDDMGSGNQNGKNSTKTGVPPPLTINIPASTKQDENSVLHLPSNNEPTATTATLDNKINNNPSTHHHSPSRPSSTSDSHIPSTTTTTTTTNSVTRTHQSIHQQYEQLIRLHHTEYQQHIHTLEYQVQQLQYHIQSYISKHEKKYSEFLKKHEVHVSTLSTRIQGIEQYTTTSYNTCTKQYHALQDTVKTHMLKLHVNMDDVRHHCTVLTNELRNNVQNMCHNVIQQHTVLQKLHITGKQPSHQTNTSTVLQPNESSRVSSPSHYTMTSTLDSSETKKNHAVPLPSSSSPSGATVSMGMSFKHDIAHMFDIRRLDRKIDELKQHLQKQLNHAISRCQYSIHDVMHGRGGKNHSNTHGHGGFYKRIPLGTLASSSKSKKSGSAATTTNDLLHEVAPLIQPSQLQERDNQGSGSMYDEITREWNDIGFMERYEPIDDIESHVKNLWLGQGVNHDETETGITGEAAVNADGETWINHNDTVDRKSTDK